MQGPGNYSQGKQKLRKRDKDGEERGEGELEREGGREEGEG